MATLYYVDAGAGARGPMAAEELIARARAGEISLDTDVCVVGESEWRRAREVPALAAVLAPPPPPRVGGIAEAGPTSGDEESDEPFVRRREEANVADARVAAAYGTWLRLDDTYLATFDAVPDAARCEARVREALAGHAFVPGDLSTTVRIEAASCFAPAYEIVVVAATRYTAMAQPYREHVDGGRTTKVRLQPIPISEDLARRRVRRWQSACESELPTPALRALLPMGPYTPATSARTDVFEHRCVPISNELDERPFGAELREEERARAVESANRLLRRRADLKFETPSLSVQTDLEVAARVVSALAVWTGSFTYRGRAYRFYVNGATGKVFVPQVPRSRLKLAGAAVAACLVIALALGAWTWMRRAAPPQAVAHATAPTGSEETFDVSIHGWAAQVLSASSEYGGGNTASAILGPPDVYPRSGDLPGAWAPASRAGRATIELRMSGDGPSCGVVVFETNGPGAVTRIEDISSSDPEVLLAAPVPATGAARSFLVPFAQRRITAVRIVVEARAGAPWPELDAVGVARCPPAVSEAGASEAGASEVGPSAAGADPEWWCACFRERDGSDAEHQVTACRRTEAACARLERAARGEGSRSIVAGSLLRECRRVAAEWLAREGWERSSVADGWVNSVRCDL